MWFVWVIGVILVFFLIIKLSASSIPSTTNKATPQHSRFVRFNPYTGDEYLISKKVSDFIAIDFETANELPLSICAAGITIVEKGKVIKSMHWYVRPKEMRFTNTHINNITADMVKDCCQFNEFWESTLRDMITDKTVVAYNASFDIGCMENALQAYGLTPTRYAVVDALHTARSTWPSLNNHKLKTVANHLCLNLNHHNAASDAEACANILLIAQTKHNHTPTLKCLRTKYPTKETIGAIAALGISRDNIEEYLPHLSVVESVLQNPYIDEKEKAVLHRKCGEAYHRCGQSLQTVVHFEKALEYNPKIGVAMLLKKIKKDIPA